MVDHIFGGRWTDEKLERLRKYLEAYTVIFTKNQKASYYHRIYVDAFAGTGIRKRDTDRTNDQAMPLFEEDYDAQDFMKGSAQVALDIKPPFHNYLFIDNNAAFAEDLRRMKHDYPRLADRITIQQGDANVKLVEWTKNTDWDSTRAVVFLDPYGMQVEWSTLEALAGTKAIDLWILFPLGLGVNRLLTRNTLPSEAWADRLTRIFGTEDWKSEFYQISPQTHLFDNDPHYNKDAAFDKISHFFQKRLESICVKVAPNPLVLLNSKNNPIFILCFAATNEKGANVAVKIARDLLER